MYRIRRVTGENFQRVFLSNHALCWLEKQFVQLARRSFSNGSSDVAIRLLVLDISGCTYTHTHTHPQTHTHRAVERGGNGGSSPQAPCISGAPQPKIGFKTFRLSRISRTSKVYLLSPNSSLLGIRIKY